MKVIQVTPYYPPHLGGLENTVKQISERLAIKKEKVKVFTSNIISNSKTNIGSLKKNLTIYYLPSVEIAHTPIIITLMYHLLRIDKKSIIHLHISHAFVPEIVLLVTRFKKVPYIAHFHIDVSSSGFFGFLLDPYKKILLGLSLKNASKVICLTNNDKNLIIMKYNIPHSKIEIVPNGVDDSYFYKRNITKKKIISLLFVGRLSKQKQVNRLINAVEFIKNTVEVNIVGEGEEYKKLETLVINKNLTNVNFHGSLYGKKLNNLYRKSDIFVLTSEREGMPLVLLEAAAMGLPIITSKLPEIYEIFKNNVTYVDTNNSYVLANKIDTLINDIKLQKKMSKNLNELAKLYSWENTVSQILEIYKTIKYEN